MERFVGVLVASRLFPKVDRHDIGHDLCDLDFGLTLGRVLVIAS